MTNEPRELLVKEGYRRGAGREFDRGGVAARARLSTLRPVPVPEIAIEVEVWRKWRPETNALSGKRVEKRERLGVE